MAPNRVVKHPELITISPEPVLKTRLTCSVLLSAAVPGLQKLCVMHDSFMDPGTGVLDITLIKT